MLNPSGSRFSLDGSVIAANDFVQAIFSRSTRKMLSFSFFEALLVTVIPWLTRLLRIFSTAKFVPGVSWKDREADDCVYPLIVTNRQMIKVQIFDMGGVSKMTLQEF